jgi:hypothetical protein
MDPFDMRAISLNKNLAEKLSTQQLLWMIKTKEFPQNEWSNYSKVAILDHIVERHFKEVSKMENMDIYELCPIYTDDYFLNHPDELLSLKSDYCAIVTFDKYNKKEIAFFKDAIKHYQNDELIAPIYGCKESAEKGIRVHLADPSMWIKLQHPEECCSLNIENTEFNQRKIAYAIFNGRGNSFALKGNNSIFRYYYILNVLFGFHDWSRGINDNTYKTHSYGYVSSYSGSEFFPDCGVTVWGESSSGDAWSLDKQGGIYFKI